MHSNLGLHDEKPLSADCQCISAHVITDTAILSSSVRTLFRLPWSPADYDDKPVIIEATEAISKSFRSNTPGKHEIKELLKKTAKLVTALILQEVLT